MNRWFFLIVLCLGLRLNAQKNSTYVKDSLESINKWTFSIAFSTVENNGNGKGSIIDNFIALKSRDANNWIPIRLSAERRLSDLFGLEFSGSLNRWNANEGFMDGEIITKDYKYFSFDAGLRFYLDELILDEALNWALASDWLDAYVTAGAGYFKINEGGFTGNIGIGVNTWVSNHIGLNFNVVAKWALESQKTAAQFDTNHTQYSLGLTYRFSSPDKDGDGIYDYNDRCPSIPGAKESFGCPKEQEAELKLEAINDSKNVEEKKETPGILLINDGQTKMLDTTDSDNDGILDHKDKCPKIAGLASNNGCPDKKNEDSLEIEKIAKEIKFETDKAVFTQKTYVILKELMSYIYRYPNSKFRIEGHTDSLGSFEHNQILSQKRADAVKKYLMNKGVPELSLEAFGFGETKPKTTNMNKAGRAVNRRVQIIQID